MEKAAGVSLHEVHRVQKSTFFAKFDIFLVNLPYSATFDPQKNRHFGGSPALYGSPPAPPPPPKISQNLTNSAKFTFLHDILGGPAPHFGIFQKVALFDKFTLLHGGLTPPKSATFLGGSAWRHFSGKWGSTGSTGVHRPFLDKFTFLHGVFGPKF